MLYAKYVYENYGYECDQENCKEYLELNEIYEVQSVDIGRSSTNIELVGYPCIFNSVNFIFFKKNEDGDYVEHDIFSDAAYNPYMR